MMKIMFVCTGNICRSPTAEAIAKSVIKQHFLENKVFAASSGLQGYHVGEHPDERTMQAGVARGYVFDSTAQVFKLSFFHEYDWILAMDRSHYSRLLKLAQESRGKAKVAEIINYCLVKEENLMEGIPDPYYGTHKDFEHVLNLLEVGVANFIKCEVLPLFPETT